jgi:soluble P-type ATPase
MVFAHLFGKTHADQRQAVFKAPDSSALTRWLRQGVEQGICPLCRVAHKADREFMWEFSIEGWANADAMGQLIAARGFCHAHAQMLERIDAEAKSMLGISGIYADLFEALLEALEHVDEHDRSPNAPCPGCANRDLAVAQNVRYLLGLLDQDEVFIERFRASTGLCFAHFPTVWTAGGPPSARALLLAVQRRTTAALGAQLREFIRKEGVEARDEPRGEEQLAWRRAIQLTAGWPAPSQSPVILEGGRAGVALTVDIPGREPLILEHLLLDQNGTLTDRGELIEGVVERLARLRDHLDPHVLSADTFGTLDQLARRLEIETLRVSTGAEKVRFLEGLGDRRCVAIGNGTNDAPMLKAAALGIAVIGREGASTAALLAADIVCGSIVSALDLLLASARRHAADLRDRGCAPRRPVDIRIAFAGMGADGVAGELTTSGRSTRR